MAWSPWRERRPEPAAPIRVEIDLGEAVTIRSSQVGSSSVVISPDGRRLVFLSFPQQVPRLMTRVLDKIEGAQSIELPGNRGRPRAVLLLGWAASGLLRRREVVEDAR